MCCFVAGQGMALKHSPGFSCAVSRFAHITRRQGCSLVLTTLDIEVLIWTHARLTCLSGGRASKITDKDCRRPHSVNPARLCRCPRHTPVSATRGSLPGHTHGHGVTQRSRSCTHPVHPVFLRIKDVEIRPLATHSSSDTPLARHLQLSEKIVRHSLIPYKSLST